jgi:hypothetical protein
MEQEKTSEEIAHESSCVDDKIYRGEQCCALCWKTNKRCEKVAIDGRYCKDHSRYCIQFVGIQKEFEIYNFYEIRFEAYVYHLIYPINKLVKKIEEMNNDIYYIQSMLNDDDEIDENWRKSESAHVEKLINEISKLEEIIDKIEFSPNNNFKFGRDETTLFNILFESPTLDIVELYLKYKFLYLGRSMKQKYCFAGTCQDWNHEKAILYLKYPLEFILHNFFNDTDPLPDIAVSDLENLSDTILWFLDNRDIITFNLKKNDRRYIERLRHSGDIWKNYISILLEYVNTLGIY